MRFLCVGSTCFATVMAFGIAGFAQQPNPPASSTPAPPATQQAPPAEQPTPAAQAAQGAQQVTIVGCVQSEADYRRARDAGKGGVAGTGVGVGNEFVLIDASMASAAGAGAPSAAGASESAAGQPIGTAGASATMNAYELTGPGEGQLTSHVGKRVEIMGTFKAGETGASGPTGGPTAGAPPSGIDITSEDLKLREFEVASVRETTGSCSPAK